MQGINAFLAVVFLLQTASTVSSQSTFPDSDLYIPLKFDLGIGNAAQITTVEGNTTDLVAQTLAVGEGQFTPGISAANEGFVQASGSRFTLNGNPWYCAGTNAYYAGLKYIMSDNEVSVMMKEHARRGATVLRVFAFSNFDSVPDPMMPDFGVYNEEAIRRLDLALVAAAENGIRLIMVMGNYWPFLGNMQDYVDRGLGPGKHYSLFYSDPTIRGYYKDWLRTIITRTNSITGQKYSEDPTVFSWELANEPRIGKNWERNQGLQPGRIICNWVAEMSAYIKSLDSNHLVCVGDEGMRTNGSTAEPHSWINTGYDGVDFQCNLAVPDVDFGTVHAYPDQWGIPPSGVEWMKDNFFGDRARIARSLNKPLIFEEYGMRAEGYLPSREPLFDFFHETANAAGYACTLVWAVSHYSTDAGSRGTLFGSNDGQGYVFGYDGDGSRSVLAQYQYQNSRNVGDTPPVPPPPTVCKDVPPPGNSYTCAQQEQWGKCGESWMAGYCLVTCGKCLSTAPPPPPPPACKDVPPPGNSYTCAQQKEWGKCRESWMAGYCQFRPGVDLSSMRVNNALVAGLLLISCGLACSKKKVPESGGHVPLEFDLDIGNGATNSTAGSKKRSVTVSQTGTQGVKSEGVSAQNVGYLEREKLLFLTGGKHAAPPVAPQPTFPDSERYIPLKFDLSIGDADQITTVEGNTTDAQTLAVEEGQFAPGISAANEGFVKASGSQFILNGNPWYCAGTNAYYAGLKYIMSDNEVFVMMKEHARQGATVLRVFAFSNFDSVPDAMMPDFGVYNEEAIRRLDLMLLAAAESGIRLVMVMANYWPFLGNMQDYVDRGLGPGKHYSLFYSDPTIRGYYKNWLRKIITRTNSITGQKYSEDPTVFSWELANEPRVGNNWEKQQGLVPGRLICDWVAEMSRYIKRFDKNHLVSVGDEGFRTNGSSAEPHSWINTGYEGVDFQCNLAARNVDFGTVHAYPDAWAIPSNGYTWLKTNFLDDRARIAKSLNKPLILEEYGMRAEGYLPFRGPLFNFFHKTANAAGYAGTLTWAVSHYSTDAGSRGTLFGSNDGQGYVYSYDGDGSQPILAQYQYQRVCTDIPRSTTYTCAQEKARDRCGTTYLKGYCKRTCGECKAVCQDNPPATAMCTSCARLRRQRTCKSSWMSGYCLQTCGKCPSFCKDIPPTATYTCAQEKQRGKCGTSYIRGYCKLTCGPCA